MDQDATYWEFASSDLMADIAEDLLGPNVKFHHSKLNFKWAEAGQEVKWHQDIQAWPHTDYSPLTMGIYLQDTSKEMGPLLCVPGSHENELFDHFDKGGKWVGHISDADLPRVTTAKAEMLAGPAGSITIHNCRTVHASEPNLSPRGRPLLLHTYSAGELFPYTPIPFRARIQARLFGGNDRNGQITILAPAWYRPTGLEGTARFSQHKASRQCEAMLVKQIRVLPLQKRSSSRAAPTQMSAPIAGPGPMIDPRFVPLARLQRRCTQVATQS